MAPPVKKLSKPVFKTSSPFTETKWPQISPEHEGVIIELLCNLLAPLGAHRAAHLPSKGKSATRKQPAPTDPPPPSPDLKNHLLIGLNSITRHLESQAAARAPPAHREEAQDATTEMEIDLNTAAPPSQPLSIIVLTHPQPNFSPAHAHIPTLLHLATLPSVIAPTQTQTQSQAKMQTRLVALPTAADARLAAALHIPRVGAVGIFEGAPGAGPLFEYVKQHVGLTECAWVDEAMEAGWRGVNVVGGK